MRCGKCGKENREGAKYCPICGNYLGTSEEAENCKKVNNAGSEKSDLKIADFRKRSKTKKIFLGVLIFILVIGAGSFAVIRTVKSARYKDLLADAQQYMKEGDYDKAEDSYCEAVKTLPGGTEAKEELTDFYIEKAENAVQDSNLTGAEENCGKALDLQGDNVKANLLMANIYEKQYKMSSAEKQYEKVLDLKPDSAEAYVKLMRVKATRDNYEEVEKMLKEAAGSSISGSALFQKYSQNYENYQRYKAYDEKLLDFGMSVKESGCLREGDGWEQTYGRCFFKLVDFDGNGTDEMVLAYTESQYTMDALPNYISDYVLEVWAFEDGELKKVFTGEPLISGTVDRICLAEKEGQWYLQTGISGAERETTFYKYEGNKFVPDMTTEINSATLEQKINGETVTPEAWSNIMAQYELEEYLLQGYNTRNGDSYTYVNAFDEYGRSECELGYLWQACFHSIMNAEVEGEKAGIKSGNYAYRSDEMDMCVNSYQFGQYGEEPQLYVTYYKEGEGRSSFYFTWDDEAGYIAEGDTEISYEQNEDALSIAIEGEYWDGIIRAELQRETQYDMDS